MLTPIHLLKRIPLFSSLSETERESLAGHLRRRALFKGEYLFRQGDEGIALHIILSGRVKISVSRQMERVTLAILVPGEFLGEMALLDGKPRSADAIALEETQIYTLDRNDFLAYLVNNETAVRAVLYALSERLRKTDDLLTDYRFLGLSARLAKKLVELSEVYASDNPAAPEQLLKITQQELGDMLGATRESINKALKHLRDRGAVSTARNAVRIHDLEWLRKAIR